MDYTDFAGFNVKITTLNGEEFESYVWGFRFEDESEEVVTEIWTKDNIVKIADIVEIKQLDNLDRLHSEKMNNYLQLLYSSKKNGLFALNARSRK